MRAGAASEYARWVRDLWRAGAFLRHPAGGPSVIILLFHGLFRDRKEIGSGTCDPQQGVTAAFFAEFVESLLAHNVAIRELEDAVRQPRPGLTAVLTFDDGYANNDYARVVLERFGVPATFFISTRHVEEQKAFWWDVLYREATRRGASRASIARQIRDLKRLTAPEIDARLTEWFGAECLAPVAECDRPFTTAELREFARSSSVSLGNHTSDHAILVNYDRAGMQEQIAGAQRFLAGLAGAAPKSIAYPNGNFDSRVLASARAAGLELGVTVRPGLNRIPATETMTLRRLTVWGGPKPAWQGQAIGSLASRVS